MERFKLLLGWKCPIEEYTIDLELIYKPKYQIWTESDQIYAQFSDLTYMGGTIPSLQRSKSK